jgi:hypothetical protein
MTTLNEALESLEEAKIRAARKKALSLSNIPLKIDERHGLFRFEGYVARSRAITCACCGTERIECLGVFMREHHDQGGFRYIVTRTWPQSEKPMRHEVQKVVEPYCYFCIQSQGFTVFEDHGEAAFNPQFKVIEEGQLSNFGTNRVVPKSVQAVLQSFSERKMDKMTLDADEMLDELLEGLDEI